ncbi:MAG: tetratricopeptide repeat protein [marine benthic group bacterium]|nr:tetratricopeptide repeat protein [Gemmatimonadota bacterium]
MSFQELLRRRVPQVAGVYLAAGWALLEFTDWAVGRFELSGRVTDILIALVLFGLPLVIVFAWRLGAVEGDPEGPERSIDMSPADTGGSKAAPGENSVAVLPFANLSDSADNEYLSDGLSEEIINALARVTGLKVVSRTSVFAWKGKPGDVREIGRALGARSVLEGSVQRAGDRLRVTTRLVDVDSGFQLWSGRFDRSMEDIFAIEDEIAGSVTRALRVLLEQEESTESRARNQPSDVRAYDYVLRGRQFFRRTRKASLEFALEMFRKAIEIDPNYAEARVGAAYSGALLRMYYPTVEGVLEEADEQSQRALELAPESSDAHAARGFVQFQLGEFDAAEDSFGRAMRLDPLQFESRYFLGRIRFQQGRHEEAAQLFDEALAAREDYQAAFFGAQAREALGRSEAATRHYRTALEVAERHMDLNPDDPRAATMRAVSLCRLGRLQEGKEWAERALMIDPADAGVRYNVACLFALQEEPERAIECLEEAIAAGFGNREWISQDPDLEALRDQPRFQALVGGLSEDISEPAE